MPGRNIPGRGVASLGSRVTGSTLAFSCWLLVRNRPCGYPRPHDLFAPTALSGDTKLVALTP